MHWLPTREMRTVRSCPDPIPDNFTIRVSAAMIDGDPPKGFTYTSTVVSVAEKDTCPSPVNGKSCADHNCTRCCLEPGNVAYLTH
jgi:hypothetical protein